MGGESRVTMSVRSWDVGRGPGVMVARLSERVREMFTASARKKVPRDVKPLISGKRLGDMITVVIIRTVGGYQ